MSFGYSNLLKKTMFFCVFSLILNNVFLSVADAGAMSDDEYEVAEVDIHPWSILGSIGYTSYGHTDSGTGQTALGRIALGKELYNSTDMYGSTVGQRKSTLDYSGLHVGLELGVQLGNRMSIYAPQSTLDVLGGLTPASTTKPMIDLLVTLQAAPTLTKTPAFLIVKGGTAYRQWQMDYNAVNNLSQFAGEAQAGAGILIADMVSLSLLYQGVFGGNPDFTVNEIGTGHVVNIPIQNGVLLTMAYVFGQ